MTTFQRYGIQKIINESDFTQRSLEHEWLCSLKVLAHFRLNELLEFSPYDTQILTIYLPTVFMARYVLVLRRAKRIRIRNPAPFC
jgi:hypothetical protein